MKKLTAIAAGFACLLLVGAMGCNKTEEAPATPPEGAMAPGGAMTPASPAAPAPGGAMAPGAPAAPAPPGPAAPK
jgi:hypothetical protein